MTITQPRVLDKDSAECGTREKPGTTEKTCDPHEHGPEDGYEFWGAVVHVMRVTFGSGILLLPYSLKATGYVTGIVLLSLVSLIYYHTLHILVRHEYRLCRRLGIDHMTYTSVAQKTFEMAPYPVNKLAPLLGKLLFAYFCLVTFNSTYLLVFAGSVQHLCAYIVDWTPTSTAIITATMVPLLVACMMRKMLQKLVPFSAATNVFSLIMAVVLLTSCTLYREPRITVHPFGDVFSVPQTIALYVQALICTSSILPVKNHMRCPHRFGTSFGALNVSAVSLTLLYGSFALIAYFCFGDKVHENILSNLPANNALSFVIHLLYALAMLVIYLLWFCVQFDNVWPEIEHLFGSTDGWSKQVAEYGLRLTMNVWYYVFAAGVPNLALILTIAGTLAMALEVALVPVLELIFELRREKKRLSVVVKDIFIIVVALALFYMSIIDCVVQIGAMYSK